MPSHFTRALALACIPLFNAHGAVAQDSGGYYVKGFGGISSVQGDSIDLGGGAASLSFDSGATFGGAIGYDYADSPFRAELEFAYRSGDAADFPPAVGTSGDIASTSLMLNGYYFFDTGNKLTPYAGLGLGVATEIDFDIEGGGNAGEYSDSGNIAYQVMIGAEYPVSNRFSIYGEARYYSAGSVDLPGPSGAVLSTDYDTFDLNAGIAFKF